MTLAPPWRACRTRRTLLAALAATAAFPSARRDPRAAEASAWPASTRSSAPLAPLVLAPQRLADGIWMVAGALDDVAPRNRGMVANTGWIAGRDAALVIDTGPSLRYGRAQREAVAATARVQVAQVVITQQSQELVFGAAAWRDAGVPVAAHAATARLIGTRCPTCLARLNEALGADEMSGSRVVVPDRTLTTVTDVALGGRTVVLRPVGPAATPGDLVAVDGATGTLFTGLLAVDGRIPHLLQEDLPGWIGALRELAREATGIVVPGVGAAGGPAILDRTRGYLEALEAGVGDALKRGLSLGEARDAVALPAPWSGWSGVRSVHPDNVQRRYLRLEAEGLR